MHHCVLLSDTNQLSWHNHCEKQALQNGFHCYEQLLFPQAKMPNKSFQDLHFWMDAPRSFLDVRNGRKGPGGVMSMSERIAFLSSL